MRGGAPVWTHPAIDPALGMVYIPTGNAWPDFDGSVRGGANLYTSSIVALDLKTGAYKWHFQEVHHDVWDYDNVVSPVLADIQYRGETRRGHLAFGQDRVVSTFSIGRTESRSSASRSERCLRNHASRRHRPSRFRSAIVRADMSRAWERTGRDEERVHLRHVLRRTGRDGARHAGRHDVGADDVQPGHQTRVCSRLDHQLGVHTQRRLLPPGRRAASRHAHGNESRDEHDRLAETTEVSDRRWERLAQHGERPDLSRRVGRPPRCLGHAWQ